MAAVLNFLEHVPAEQRRRPEELKHEGGFYTLERRVWRDDTICKNFQESAFWAFLIGEAEHRADGRMKQLGGHEFHLGYGQVLTSERALAEFVGWSNHRVHRFLVRLAEGARITVEPVHAPSRGRPTGVPVGIRITICNYGYYQRGEVDASHGRPTVVSRSSHTLSKEERKVRSPSCEQESVNHNPAGAGHPAKSYAFKGAVVRLLPDDFERWRKAFHNLDLRAELQCRDDWLAEQGTAKDRKAWFVSTSNWLASRNKRTAAADEGRGGKPRNARTGRLCELNDELLKVGGKFDREAYLRGSGSSA